MDRQKLIDGMREDPRPAAVRSYALGAIRAVLLCPIDAEHDIAEIAEIIAALDEVVR